MIEINSLTDRDIGRTVLYHANHVNILDALREGTKNVNGVDVGVIKSWNDKYVFVVFHCDNNWKEFMNYTGVATNPNDLVFI